MIVKGKALISSILGIIGGVLLVISGINAFGIQAIREEILDPLFMTWESIGFNPIIFTISAIVTVVLGVLGIIGAILSLLDKRNGVFLMLICGIIATVGMFIPIGTYTIFETYTVFLNTPLYFVDPFILLAGGILGFLILLKDY